MTPAEREATITARLFQDVWAQAWAATWERRARAFEWSAPRPGDYTGRATPEQLEDRARRAEAAALACRRRATGADGLVDLALIHTVDDTVDRARQDVA